LYTFDFILINGFTEGIVHFLITGTNGDGKPCTYEFALELKDCEASTVTAKKITQAVNSTTSLLIYPNPTHGGDTKAQFECTSETALIAIYDLTGKQLASYNAPNKKGTVTLNTSQLAAGVYVVVLKEEGKTTLQKKLVVE
jgi:hypothetical protein